MRWPTGTRERLALVLLLYTGQRRGDMVRMGRQHMSGDTIRVTQNKTGASLVFPMHPKLRAEIDASANTNHLTFLVTNWGRPFSAAGFGNWFRDVCDEAKLAGRSTHGLRKSGGEAIGRSRVQRAANPSHHGPQNARGIHALHRRRRSRALGARCDQADG